MRVSLVGAICVLAFAGDAKSQIFDKNTTVGSVMVDSTERKRTMLIGLAEGFSAKYPNIKLSDFTRCLEEVADLPVNWKKQIGPFAKDCAEKLAAR